MAEPKIASIVLNWNMEQWLVPHIEMLSSQVDKIIYIQPTRPFEPYRREHGYSLKPDNSEDIIRRNYPEIEIYHYEPEDEDPAWMFSNAWNFGLEKLQAFDLITKFDVDQFFTKDDFKQLIDYVKSANYPCYALDWATQSINYYKDLDHGLKDQLETDPLIISPDYKFGALLEYPARKHIVDLDITMHHLRQFKNWVTSEWLSGDIPSPHGVYSTDLLRQYGNNGTWYIAPAEIKTLFD